MELHPSLTVHTEISLGRPPINRRVYNAIRPNRYYDINLP